MEDDDENATRHAWGMPGPVTVDGTSWKEPDDIFSRLHSFEPQSEGQQQMDSERRRRQ